MSHVKAVEVRYIVEKRVEEGLGRFWYGSQGESGHGESRKGKAVMEWCSSECSGLSGSVMVGQFWSGVAGSQLGMFRRGVVLG